MSQNNGIASRESRASSARASTSTRVSSRAPRKVSQRRRTTTARASRRGLVARTRRSMQQAGMSLGKTVMDYEERGEQTAHAVMGAVKRFVRDEPVKSAFLCTSLALAAGAGLWAGRLLALRDWRKMLRQYDR